MTDRIANRTQLVTAYEKRFDVSPDKARSDVAKALDKGSGPHPSKLVARVSQAVQALLADGFTLPGPMERFRLQLAQPAAQNVAGAAAGTTTASSSFLAMRTGQLTVPADAPKTTPPEAIKRVLAAQKLLLDHARGFEEGWGERFELRAVYSEFLERDAADKIAPKPTADIDALARKLADIEHPPVLELASAREANEAFGGGMVRVGKGDKAKVTYPTADLLVHVMKAKDFERMAKSANLDALMAETAAMSPTAGAVDMTRVTADKRKTLDSAAIADGAALGFGDVAVLYAPERWGDDESLFEIKGTPYNDHWGAGFAVSNTKICALQLLTDDADAIEGLRASLGRLGLGISLVSSDGRVID